MQQISMQGLVERDFFFFFETTVFTDTHTLIVPLLKSTKHLMHHGGLPSMQAPRCSYPGFSAVTQRTLQL